jgi:hypothetical protein
MSARVARVLKVAVPALALPAVAQVVIARSWLHGGATYEEKNRHLPGDEILGSAAVQATRAITVRAAVESVWPWIVQLGTGRGGWYTDEGGAKVHHLEPGLQTLERHDVIIDPSGRMELTVARIDPPWELVLSGHPDPPGAGTLDLTWAFVLVPLAEDRTRLLVRVRYAGANLGRVRTFAHSLELVDAVFTRRMLRGIAALAEQTGWLPLPPPDDVFGAVPVPGVGSMR